MFQDFAQFLDLEFLNSVPWMIWPKVWRAHNIGYWIDNAHTNTFRDNITGDCVRKSLRLTYFKFS